MRPPPPGSNAFPLRQQQQDLGLQSTFTTLKAFFAGAFCSMKYLLPPTQHGDGDTWSIRTYGLKAYPVWITTINIARSKAEEAWYSSKVFIGLLSLLTSTAALTLSLMQVNTRLLVTAAFKPQVLEHGWVLRMPEVGSNDNCYQKCHFSQLLIPSFVTSPPYAGLH